MKHMNDFRSPVTCNVYLNLLTSIVVIVMYGCKWHENLLLRSV